MRDTLINYHGRTTKAAREAVRVLTKIIRSVPDSDAEQIVRFIMAHMAYEVFEHHSAMLGHDTDKSAEGRAKDLRVINQLTVNALLNLEDVNDPEVYGEDGFMAWLAEALQQAKGKENT